MTISIDIVYILSLVNEELANLLLAVPCGVVQWSLLEIVLLFGVDTLLNKLGQHIDRLLFVFNVDGGEK